MAIFGRSAARQRLRRAAAESLRIPAFSTPAVDCTPWVTGGLWPAELSTVTPETAPLVKYLKADLQRIVSTANDEITRIRGAGLADSDRRAQEARAISDARGYAVRRVESSVRHLRHTTTKSHAPQQPVKGTAEAETTQRFKLVPPRPEPEQVPEPATPTTEFRPFEDQAEREPEENGPQHNSASAGSAAVRPDSDETVQIATPSSLEPDDTAAPFARAMNEAPAPSLPDADDTMEIATPSSLEPDDTAAPFARDTEEPAASGLPDSDDTMEIATPSPLEPEDTAEPFARETTEGTVPSSRDDADTANPFARDTEEPAAPGQPDPDDTMEIATSSLRDADETPSLPDSDQTMEFAARSPLEPDDTAAPFARAMNEAPAPSMPDADETPSLPDSDQTMEFAAPSPLEPDDTAAPFARDTEEPAASGQPDPDETMEFAAPSSLAPDDTATPSPLAPDDTAALEELDDLLQEFSVALTPPPPPPSPSPSPPPPQQPATPSAPVPMFEPPSPTAADPEPAQHHTETARHALPPARVEAGPERLQRLLAFVARQQPGLHWTIGNRDDGTTLLVTDFAHGWIPPGITLPADVHLLEPGRRTGAAAALLGPTTLSATYAPGDPLGWSADHADTSTSTQPRALPAVESPGWVLSEATHWRDGLPRMVNTLAKAAVRGTGVVGAELDILRTYLNTARYQVLAQYPDIDDGLLLNCLLLAATESVVSNDWLTANYHLAWFQKLSSPGVEWS